jgi:hypothetical protein
MSEALEKILVLWELDRSIQKLAGLMGDLEEEEQRLIKRIAAEDEAWQARLEAHRELRHQANAKALEVDETDEKIRAYQKKLDQDIIPYKEMEYLREQVTFLKERLEELEEEAIRLLNQVEEDEAKLTQDEQEHKDRRQRLADDLEEIRARREKLHRQWEELQTKRAQAVDMLPPHLKEHYQRLAETLSDPVAVVENNTCGGCHLRLSETLLERVREGREVVFCENCSRFLLARWR